MDKLRSLGTLELGALSAKIVIDPQGRKCVEVPIGEGVYCFTISQALMFREMLDLAISTMAKFTPNHEEIS